METPYSDEEQLDSYLRSYAKYYITDLERRSLDICYRDYKIREAQQSEDEFFRELGEQKAIQFATQQIADDLLPALAIGLLQYRESVIQRLLRNVQSGSITINRCPKCGRIVRTPRARQCRWCGFDWHNA